MAAVDKSLYEKFTIESVSKAKTADIKAGRYVYDVYINGLGENVRIVEGTALVRAGVTR